MSPSVSAFVFELVNFALLAVGLGWAFFSPMRKALAEESAEHAAERDAASRAHAEAEAALSEAERARAEAGGLAEKLRAETLAAARAEASRLLAEAREREGELRASLDRELDARTEMQVIALSERLGEVAARSVRALLAHLEGPALDAALVRGATTELARLPAEALREATVEAARELDGGSMALLSTTLGTTPKPRIVPELGAGIRVTTSKGQVDATASAIARRVAGEVRGTVVAKDGEPRHDG